jgi:Ni/Co efflux regulator RcnB
MLEKSSIIVFVFFISLAVITSFAIANPPEGKGKQGKEKAYKQKKDKSDDQGNDGSGALISINVRYEDVRPIAVANHYIGYKSLPPGIRKNLMRGKPLPPGIAKKMVPDPMLLKLPRYEGYEWRICGSDLILATIATGIVQEVIQGVFK